MEITKRSRFNIQYVKPEYQKAHGYPCHVVELRPVGSPVQFTECERTGVRYVLVPATAEQKAAVAASMALGKNQLEKKALTPALLDIEHDLAAQVGQGKEVPIRTDMVTEASMLRVRSAKYPQGEGDLVNVEQRDIPLALILNVEISVDCESAMLKRTHTLNPDRLPIADGKLELADLVEIPKDKQPVLVELPKAPVKALAPALPLEGK